MFFEDFCLFQQSSNMLAEFYEIVVMKNSAFSFLKTAAVAILSFDIDLS